MIKILQGMLIVFLLAFVSFKAINRPEVKEEAVGKQLAEKFKVPQHEEQRNICEVLTKNRKFLVKDPWFMKQLGEEIEEEIVAGTPGFKELHNSWQDKWHINFPANKFSEAWFNAWLGSKTSASISQRSANDNCKTEAEETAILVNKTVTMLDETGRHKTSKKNWEQFLDNLS